jgi:hypothetical protein
LCGHPAPLVVYPPLVLDRSSQSLDAKMVLHRNVHIIFTRYDASNFCDCLSGDNFGYEHNTPSVFSALVAANVEAEVYFIKIRMKGDSDSPEEFGVAKAKAHKADICLPQERIQDCAGRHVVGQQTGVNFVVQQDEIALPLTCID